MDFEREIIKIFQSTQNSYKYYWWYSILNIVKDFFNSEKIFTDTLSTKNTIIEFMNDNSFLEINNFILSHPMAGTENYGIENS